MRIETIGQVAFEAYTTAKGGKTHDGKPIPEWRDLGDDVRAAWGAAAQAVWNEAQAEHLAEMTVAGRNANRK